MESILTLVLAGGRCKRMDIFCRHKAKPAISFAGNTRIIDYVLSNCIHSKAGNITVLIDYHRISMAMYLSRWAAANGGSKNIHFLEPKYGTYQGNADAVYQNIDFIKKSPSDLVMILSGDHIYKMDYQQMLNHHRQSGADATISVISVPIEQANRFGVVTVEDNSKVMGFIEKPDIPQSDLISMGIYVFNKQLLIERLIEDASIASSPHDFGHAILPRMIRMHNVSAYRFNGYWRDAGILQDYYEANLEQLPEATPSMSGDEWTILTEPNRLSPPKISSRGDVQNSIISPGCVIKGQVLNSVLSPGVWVEEEAVVRDSVIMANSFIGYHSVVDHCVLSEGTNVGRLCYLGFGGSVNQGEGEGVTVLGDQVTVPPHTAIGRNCKILPHMGLSDFTRKVIPSDSVISPQPSRRTWDEGIPGDVNKHLRVFRPIE